jgi:hypothetical protein
MQDRTSTCRRKRNVRSYAACTRSIAALRAPYVSADIPVFIDRNFIPICTPPHVQLFFVMTIFWRHFAPDWRTFTHKIGQTTTVQLSDIDAVANTTGRIYS